MTTNQIAYWNLKENERTHRANESIGQSQAEAANINAAANRRNAETRASELGETVRHNKTEEGIGIANAVTGGIGNVGKGVGSVISSIGKILL